jgi:Rv0078B-related antitoxin
MTVSNDGPYPLQIALELTDLGARMLAQRCRRDHPGWSDGEIDAAVDAWFASRPGAPDGDCVGRPGDLSRFA